MDAVRRCDGHGRRGRRGPLAFRFDWRPSCYRRSRRIFNRDDFGKGQFVGAPPLAEVGTETGCKGATPGERNKPQAAGVARREGSDLGGENRRFAGVRPAAVTLDRLLVIGSSLRQ